MICFVGAFHSLYHCVDLKNNVELCDGDGDGDGNDDGDNNRLSEKNARRRKQKNECRLIRESILDAATRIMF